MIKIKLSKLDGYGMVPRAENGIHIGSIRRFGRHEIRQSISTPWDHKFIVKWLNWKLFEILNDTGAHVLGERPDHEDAISVDERCEYHQENSEHANNTTPPETKKFVNDIKLKFKSFLISFSTHWTKMGLRESAAASTAHGTG